MWRNFDYETVLANRAKKSTNISQPSLKPEGYEDFAPLIDILDLRPTQFVVGAASVLAKINALKQLHDMKDAALIEAYYREKIVPTIVSPGGHRYMIDHHHTCLAFLLSPTVEVDKVYYEDIADWSDKSWDEFWRLMEDHAYCYLLVDGKGPYHPRLLPKSLLELTDDPFRSLAWAARHTDPPGYDKLQIPYVEFRWADHMRAHPALVGKPIAGNELSGHTLELAVKICQEEAASGLPGYIGPKEPEVKLEEGPVRGFYLRQQWDWEHVPHIAGFRRPEYYIGLLLCCADTPITDEERNFVVGLAAAQGVPLDLVRELNTMKRGDENDLARNLTRLRFTGCERPFIYHAFWTAAQDGEITNDELRRVRTAGRLLGMEDAEVRRIYDLVLREHAQRRDRIIRLMGLRRRTANMADLYNGDQYTSGV